MLRSTDSTTSLSCSRLAEPLRSFKSTSPARLNEVLLLLRWITTQKRSSCTCFVLQGGGDYGELPDIVQVCHIVFRVAIYFVKVARYFFKVARYLLTVLRYNFLESVTYMTVSDFSVYEVGNSAEIFWLPQMDRNRDKVVQNNYHLSCTTDLFPLTIE